MLILVCLNTIKSKTFLISIIINISLIKINKMSLNEKDNQQNLINDLEIYIDCLKEITEDFNKNTNQTYNKREEVN